MFRRIDPMVRLLVAAILLATLLPVKGPAREWAQWVSNGAVFSLFFFYGLRLSRREVLRGLGNHRLLIPLIAVFFEAFENHAVQLRRQVCPQGGRGCRRLVEN